MKKIGQFLHWAGLGWQKLLPAALHSRWNTDIFIPVFPAITWVQQKLFTQAFAGQMGAAKHEIIQCEKSDSK